MRSRRRRRLPALALAVTVVLGAEGALRLGGYGAREPFFVTRTDTAGVAWHTANGSVGDNWFRGPEWEPAIKRPRGARFRDDEPGASGPRVFVLGESAAYGTPWGDDLAWPALLQALLPPGAEVQNVGVRASSLDIQPAIVAELRAYDPDAFVIYAGHNEFYGVREPSFVEDLRLVRLFAGLRSAPPGTGVGLRAGAAVAPGDERRMEVEERAARDLARVVAAAGPVPVVWVVPWGNERDVAPIGSYVPADQASEGTRADALVAQIEADPALATASRTELQDLAEALPTHAGLAHALGLATLATGDLPGAERWFTQAVDQDTVPIRAPSGLREALRGVDGVHVCDPGRRLRRVDPHGLLGDAQFFDHVHLTFEGGYAVASSVADCLRSLPGLSLAPPTEPLDAPAFAAQVGLTPLDVWAAYATTERYFERATVSASPSRSRSIAACRAREAELLTEMDPVSRGVAAANPGEHPRTALARASTGRSPAEQAAAWRAAIRADPTDPALYAALAAVSDQPAEVEAARTWAALYGEASNTSR